MIQIDIRDDCDVWMVLEKRSLVFTGFDDKVL